MAAFVWALTNIIVRSQSDRMDMLSLNTLRCLAAVPFALLSPFMLRTNVILAETSVLAYLYVVAGGVITMVIGDITYFKSQKALGVSRAQPISNIYPIFTLLLATAFLGEQPTWTLAVSILLLLLGTYLLVERSDTAVNGRTDASAMSPRLGLGLALGAGGFWAIGTTFLGLGLLELDPLMANQLRIPAVAAILLLAMRLSGRPMDFRRHGWRALWLIAGAGILGVAVGSLLFLYSVQATGASKAALLSSLSPFFAAPLAAIFLHERVTWRTALGMLLCVGSVWLVLLPASAA